MSEHLKPIIPRLYTVKQLSKQQKIGMPINYIRISERYLLDSTRSFMHICTYFIAYLFRGKV